MKTIFINQYFLFVVLTIFHFPTLAEGFFEDGEEYIWKSGRNRYFKYSPIEKGIAIKNDHPVKLNSKEIGQALRLLEYSEDKNILRDELTAVFSTAQINTISINLAKALRTAKPDQDIIFVIEGLSKKLLLLTDKTFTACRAFYRDGKLNIIIGEYEYARNQAFENVYDPSGKGNIPYQFDFGSRNRSTNKFRDYLVETTGIELKRVGNKTRRDWFVIDVKQASETYVALKQGNNSAEQKQDRALQLEAAKLAKERREMRREMAIMRKEMQQLNQSDHVSVKSIEQRMATLDELKKKGLLSKEEYAQKRQEILQDI